MIRKLLYIAFSLSLLALGGCSADEPFSLPGADGNTTLTLLVPSTELAYATRAAADQHDKRTATEGKITRLTVAGFYEDGSTKHHFFAELTEDMSSQVEDVYRSYKLSVVPADYRLYVLANIDLETQNKALFDKLSASTTASNLESDLEAFTYSYASSLPDADAGLPMAKKISADVKTNQNKQVVVPLEYICAKARLTVIYPNAFGSANKFKINGMDVIKAYTPTGVFDNTKNGSSTFDKTGLAGTHYQLSDEQASKTLDEWTAMPTDLTKDPLDGFTTKLTGSGPWENFAWQQTVYLPECLNKGTSTTKFVLHTPKDVSGAGKDIMIGCSGTTTDDHSQNAPASIERGNFYDIVALIADNGEIEYKWKVLGWNLKDLVVQLAGKSRLFLAKTEIKAIDGNTPIEIEYDTDAPSLSFEPTKVKYGSMAQELPVVDITEDKANKKLIVNVNPDLPLRSELLEEEDMGFWVVAGSIRKWVSVKSVDLQAYLRLLPTVRTLSIRNIVNEAEYSVWFNFATNADNLKLQMTELANTNTDKGFVDGSSPQGIYLEICNSDSIAITRKIKLNEITLSEDNNLLKTDYLKDNKSYSKDGLIKVTVCDPTAASYFSKEIDATFVAKADGVPDKKAELEIQPNPTVYTIHFKQINGSVAWTSPHIYVYQPLTYNGLEVYGTTNDNNVAKSITWVEYSFTGNQAFLGWKKDGGTINNLSSSQKSNSISYGGETVPGYDLGEDWGDPGVETSINDTRYQFVSFVSPNTAKCSSCQSGRKKLWPGVVMEQEKDENGNPNGWWKIELPLIAKPDKTLIMFNDGHSDAGRRYPKHNDPGIPLPNYSDREAWYLLDELIGGEKCSFSDDRRDTYGSGTVTTTVYIAGNHNNWGGPGVTPDANGICKWENMAIGDKDFKVKIMRGSTPDWRSNGQSLESGTAYTMTGDNNSNMTMSGAQSDWVCNVEWNNNTNQLTVTKVSGSVSTRKVALWWYQGKFGSEKLCFFTGSNDANSSYWPGEDYPYREGSYIKYNNNEMRYIVLSSSSDLAAFDKLKSNDSAGYAFYNNSLVWWNNNKHREALEQWLKDLGVTEAYEIWQ